MAEPKFTGTNPYELMQQSLAGEEARRKAALARENVSSYSTPKTDVFLMEAGGTTGVDYAGNIVNLDSSNVGVVAGNVTPGGSSNTPVITPTGGRVGTGPVGGTEIGETPPKEGDFKAGPDGKPLVFKNGRWEVYTGGTTREIRTEDPATIAAREQEMAGADANVPIDKYMQSLGTDTLAGQAYTDALARRLASIDEQQLAAGQSYGDMYEQAKMSQAARRGLSDVSGRTGGMADQAQ
jgi:hypothetical protein